MKKLLTFVFSICLLIPCLFILSACSDAPTAQKLIVEFADENKQIEHNTLKYTYGDTINIANEEFKVSVLLSNSTVKELSHKTTNEKGQSVDGYVKETNLPKEGIVPAGEYYVKFTYSDLEAIELAIIVNKAQIDMTNVKWDYTKLTYNGEEQSVKLLNLPEMISVTYTGNTATNASKDNSSYTASASFDFDRDNYELKNNNITSLKWKINKCPLNLINVKWDYTTPFTYDGKDKTVLLTNVPKEIEVDYDNNIKTFAGTYTATVKLKYDIQNYQLVNNNITDCKWVINKTSTIVKSLQQLEDAIENNSYDKIIVAESIDLSKSITLTKDKTIIVNSGAILTTPTNLVKQGTIIANVGNINEFTAATEYADKIILVNNITPEENASEEEKLIVISAKDHSYNFDIDLAGFSINYNIEFNNSYILPEGTILHRTIYTCNVNIINSSKTASYIGALDNSTTDVAVTIDINVEYEIYIQLEYLKVQVRGATNIVES